MYRKPGQWISNSELPELDAVVAKALLFQCYERYSRRAMAMEGVTARLEEIDKKCDKGVQTMADLVGESDPSNFRSMMLRAGVSPHVVALLRDHVI